MYIILPPSPVTATARNLSVYTTGIFTVCIQRLCLRDHQKAVPWIIRLFTTTEEVPNFCTTERNRNNENSGEYQHNTGDGYNYLIEEGGGR